VAGPWRADRSLPPRLVGRTACRTLKSPGRECSASTTTTIDLDTGQVLGVVDGVDHEGVGDWLFEVPFQRRLGVQVVATDPSAAVQKY
jgi:hypothetical protein